MNKLLKLAVLIVTLAIVHRCIFKENDIPLEFGSGSFVSPGWEKVADTFKKQLASGSQKGGAFAVYHKGKLVVDLSGGYADDEADMLFTSDTLSALFSTTKGIAAIVMAMLVDRGLLDYSKPVSHYWPEFAQNGKGKITVKQLLSHQAGLSGTDEEMSFLEFNSDPEKIGRILAEQKPYWTPGENVGYHTITLGIYEDQLLRRVDPKHRSMAQFFQEEVASPFELDLYIGLPKEYFYRISRNYYINMLSVEMLLSPQLWPLYWHLFLSGSEVSKKTFLNPKELKVSGMWNNPYVMEANSPASHGVGSAKAVAKLNGIVANGGKLGKKKLLSESLIRQLNKPVKSGIDLNIGINLTYGLGTNIWDSPLGGKMFGTAGAGGQMGLADIEHRLGCGYVMNHMSLHMMDPMFVELKEAMYDCVKSLPKE